MAEKRKTMKGAAMGSIALRLLRELPESQVGWLTKAWIAYRVDGEEPGEVPAECFAAWLAIREEVDYMAEVSKIRSELGKVGMKKRWHKGEADNKAITNDNGAITNDNTREERRGEENITHPSGCVHTPTPTLTQTREESIPQGLADSMADAPISPVDALDYAKGPQCGLTEEQVMAWANWNAERGWMRSVGGSAVRKMDRRGAESSLRSWRTKQAEFDAIKRGQDKQQGNIRGVRIAGSGNIKKKLEI